MNLSRFNVQKMYKQIPVILLLMLLFLPFPAAAENALQKEQVLSLEQAVLIALGHNPSYAQQENTVESAEITVSQQQANFYPDLNFRASGSEDLDMNVELSTSVNLFNGFADNAALKNSEQLLKAELESLSQEEQTLIFETFSLFIQVLTNQELIHVEEVNLENNNKLLEQIEMFQQVGKLPISDLYQQQAETKQAELDLLEAQNSLTISKLDLIQTLGLPPTDQYAVSPLDFDKLALGLPGDDSVQLADLALAHRADIKAQEHQVQAAKEQIREAKAGHLPTVDLAAALASEYSGYWDETMDEDLGSSIGVTFSIPLYDRHLTRNNTVKAQIAKRNEQLSLKEKKLQVGLEIAQAIQDYQTTQKKIEVVESKLTYAQEALQSYEERYRVGASTLVELSQARTGYVTASYDKIKAKYDLVTQKISIAYYLGDIDRMFTALSLEREDENEKK